MTLHALYERLHAAYGAQCWWPADTPFEVMVGAILTQNTAWTNVEKAIANLKREQALDAQILAHTEPALLVEWIRPSGYYNIKARRLQNLCRWLLDAGGEEGLRTIDTPVLRAQLLTVNGVGAETADSILLYALRRPVFVIDAYTRRLFSRLGLIDGAESYEELRELCERSLVASTDTVHLFSEYHALIVTHAKQACRKRPMCQNCTLRLHCPYQPQ